MKNPKKCTICCWDSAGEAHRCGYCCRCRHPFISNRMSNTVKFNPKLIPVMDAPQQTRIKKISTSKDISL